MLGELQDLKVSLYQKVRIELILNLILVWPQSKKKKRNKIICPLSIDAKHYTRTCFPSILGFFLSSRVSIVSYHF